MKRTLPFLTLFLASSLLFVSACSRQESDEGSLVRGKTLPPPPRVVVAAPASVEVTPVETAGTDPSADASANRERPELLVEDPVREGRLAWEQGDFASSARFLEAAVEQGKAAPYDVYLLGLAHWKSGELVRAEAELVEATWSMQSFARAPLNLARVRLGLDDVAGAGEAIEAALALDPESAPAHNVLGRVLLAKGDRDGANEAFRRAVELDPTNPWPRNNLGYLYLIREQIQEALGALEGAVEADPEMAEAWHNLALVREKGGDPVGAHAAAMAALALRPGSERLAATETRLAALVPDQNDAVHVADTQALPVEPEQEVSEEVVASLEK